MLAMLFSIVQAETLTLDDCLNLALENDPRMIQAKGAVSNANGYLWNTAGQFLPSLSAGGSVTQINSEPRLQVIDGQVRPSSGITKSYNLSASSYLTIFNGGRNFFDYFRARSNKAFYKYLFEQAEQDIILQVKQYYFNYLKAQKTLEIQKEAVKRGEEQFKLANSKFEVGSASKSDVLKAKVQYGTDQLNLIEARNAVEKTHANLAYIIGIDVNSDLDISTEFSAKKYDGTMDDALKFGMSNHPGFLAAEKNMGAAKWGVRSAWGRFLPTVGVSVSRSYQNEFWHRVTDLSKNDGQWVVSTSLNLPIFDNFSRKQAISSAKVALNNSRASYYYAKNDIARAVKTAYLDMERAQEQLNVAGETVDAANEDMALTQEKYNLGAATILELLEAQEDLIGAQNSKINAEFDYNLAVAALENAMGVK
jgi:TolC family type I secretion outer membrane protein